MGKRKKIFIPIKNSSEVVKVYADDLPSDVTDIINILQAEIAPLDLWIEFAVAYYNQGNIPAFIEILEEGTDPDSKRERIAILNTLAAHYTKLGKKEKDKNKREDLFTKATSYYNAADKIDVREELTWAGKGVLTLAKGDTNRAFDYFDNVLKANPKSIPGLLGKANLLYAKEKYEEALECYKTVLRTNPQCAPSIRLGLGYCYYQLHRPQAAKLAFQRVMKLVCHISSLGLILKDPKNVEALVGLAIIELNSEGTQGIESAMKFFNKAFLRNPSYPMALNHLANHFFYKQDFPRVQELALKAYHNSDVEHIKGESCYHIARAYHARGDYSLASKYYTQALHHWPAFPLAQFGNRLRVGMGQMYLYEGKMESALHSFESVLGAFPDSFETLKIVGSLSAATNRKERELTKGFTHLKRVTEEKSGSVDPLAWIELAEVVEPSHPSQALQYYLHAVRLFEEKGETVPPELWNNVGALKCSQGKFEESSEAFLAALKGFHSTETEFTPEGVSTIYNLARLREEECRFDEATRLYKALIKGYPGYLEGYLRLSCLAKVTFSFEESHQRVGKIEEAMEWILEAFQFAKTPEGWSLLGNLHMEREEWLPAQKKFEEILEHNKQDTYALLSLGNIYYYFASKYEKKEKIEKYLKLAKDFYWKVLTIDPSNLFAVNGLGIIYAENGKTAEAKECFNQVREGTTDSSDSFDRCQVPHVWINQGHLALTQGLHVNAIKSYQNCIRRFHSNKNERDVTVLGFLARAFFESGRMEDSKKILTKAIHSRPWDQTLWFNLALTEEQFSTSILRKKSPASREILKAMKEMQNSLRHFRFVAEGGGGDTSNLKGEALNLKKKAEKYVKYVTMALESAKSHLRKAEEEEKEQAKLLKEKELETEEMMLLEAREEEARERQREEMKKREEMAAREYAEQTEQILKSVALAQSQAAEKEERRKGKKRRKEALGEDDIYDDNVNANVEEMEDSLRQMKERKRTRSQRNRESYQEEDEEVPLERKEKKRKKEKKDKKEKKEKKPKKEKKKKKKSFADLFGESDEEEQKVDQNGEGEEKEGEEMEGVEEGREGDENNEVPQEDEQPKAEVEENSKEDAPTGEKEFALDDELDL